MQLKLFAAAIVAVSFATPAFAQGFYIVRDSGTKKCTIVSERPTTTTTVVSPAGTRYTTRAEAEAEMKTLKVCEPN
jgi:hypothetical protein